MTGPYDAVVESPVGWLGIRCEGEAIAVLEILAARPAARDDAPPAARRVRTALVAYFGGDRRALDSLLVRPAGTSFQRRVWERLRSIPPGQAVSYGELARELRTSARAIGGACRANPVPLVVPCHRVVASSGLGGYSGTRSGDWLAKKRWLLGHEGVAC